MQAAIVDHRIVGTRITVFDIVHYRENGWSPAEIAASLRLSPEQVQAAIQYIEAHKDEVMAIHQQIEERMARGNPPDLQAKLDAGHERFQEMLRRCREAKSKEVNGEGHPGRQ